MLIDRTRSSEQNRNSNSEDESCWEIGGEVIRKENIKGAKSDWICFHSDLKIFTYCSSQSNEQLTSCILSLAAESRPHMILFRVYMTDVMFNTLIVQSGLLLCDHYHWFDLTAVPNR